jgi:hypothetical protein
MPSEDSKPGTRKLWHDSVERAVQTAAASGKPFTVGQVLDRIGVFTWAPYRAQAFEYANKMLATANKAATGKGERRCHNSKPTP